MEGSHIAGKDKEELEQTIVEYNNIFVSQQSNIGIKNNFRVKLTPQEESPVYTQSRSI